MLYHCAISALTMAIPSQLKFNVATCSATVLYQWQLLLRVEIYSTLESLEGKQVRHRGRLRHYGWFEPAWAPSFSICPLPVETSVETMLEENKPVITRKIRLEERDKSKLKEVFGDFWLAGFRCKEKRKRQNFSVNSFFATVKFPIESLMEGIERMIRE